MRTSGVAHRWTPWVRIALVLVAAGFCAWSVVESLRGYRVHRAVVEARGHTAWGRLEDAEQALAAAAQREPHVASLHMALGAARESLARFRGSPADAEAALEAYARAAALDPLDAAPHVAAAWMFVFMERHSDAAHALNRALARDPHNSYYLASLGYVHELQGDEDAAAAHYRRSLAILHDREIERRLERLPTP